MPAEVSPKHADKVDKVRELYLTGKYSLQQLAEISGVPKNTLEGWPKKFGWAQILQAQRQGPDVEKTRIQKEISWYTDQTAELQKQIDAASKESDINTLAKKLKLYNEQRKAAIEAYNKLGDKTSFQNVCHVINDMVDHIHRRAETEERKRLSALLLQFLEDKVQQAENVFE